MKTLFVCISRELPLDGAACRNDLRGACRDEIIECIDLDSLLSNLESPETDNIGLIALFSVKKEETRILIQEICQAFKGLLIVVGDCSEQYDMNGASVVEFRNHGLIDWKVVLDNAKDLMGISQPAAA